MIYLFVLHDFEAVPVERRWYYALLTADLMLATSFASESNANCFTRSRDELWRSPAGLARYLATYFPNRIGDMLK